MGIVFFRTLILYVVLAVTLRVGGKRQIGEMQPLELVVAILLSDMASIPMQNLDFPLLYGIVPIFSLISFEVLLSAMSLNNRHFNRFIYGTPVLLINKGELDQRALKKNRLTLDDLVESLRLKDISDISTVDYAIMETTGKISTVLKGEEKNPTAKQLNVTPDTSGMSNTIIYNGVLNLTAIKNMNKDQKWVLDELKKQSITNISQVYYMSINGNDIPNIIKKEMK